ncbi:MAG: TatD family hydrolase [Candidatus Micrarchaeota archaeon]|nr:TatD family hydrolase [Candidatus Micrarchaeota archaeon]
MPLVDAHCHLEHPRFGNEAGKVVERAKAAGLGFAVTAGSNFSNNQKALGLCRDYPDFLKCVIGLSPHDANAEELEENLRLIKSNKGAIAGIGEIGLEYHHFKTHEERSKQRAVFAAQLALAGDLGLPVAVHSREAEKDVFDALKSFTGRVMMHCFIKPEWAGECAARGYLVSIPTVKCREREEMIRKMPLEQLLCETDSPFLWQGGRNEPANVREAYGEIARVKGVDFNKVAEVVYSSANAVFRGP